nr:peroxisomal (S)-2-hydroxy-acid oxidase GLO4-like [Tanacetum cinerariifolium]
LLPRILVDVSKVDMSTKILGYKTSAPIIIAPTAMHKLAHPGGEILTAKAAAACNVIMGLSFMSTCTIEEILNRRDISALMVKRAETNGLKAILLTVDTPRLGRREDDVGILQLVNRLTVRVRSGYGSCKGHMINTHNIHQKRT